MTTSKTAGALLPTPTRDTLPRRFSDFNTLPEALAYAAQGQRGANFYDARGSLKSIISFSDIHRKAQTIGKQLLGLGFRPGDRMALIAETSPDFICYFLGAMEAGLWPVPLPLPTSFGGKTNYVQQMRSQIESCDAAVVVGPDDLLTILKSATDSLPVRWVGGWRDFDALPVSKQPLPHALTGDIAYIQYSSGSTRFPHGVIITHASLMNNCHIQGKYGVQVQDSDRSVSWLPFYHDMGLVGGFLTALCSQVSMDFLATEDFARRPLTWLKMISDNPDTSACFSPSFGYDITTRRVGPEALAKFDLSRWRLAGNGGDMIRPDVMQKFIDTFAPCGFRAEAFVPSYGLAECTLGVSFMPLGEGIVTDEVDKAVLRDIGLKLKSDDIGGTRQFVNCGKPLPGYDIQIRSRDGEVLSGRSIGTLFVKGPSVMQGYYRDAEATAACLSADGWLDTGDMAYLANGYIYIVGRMKDMIIINGKNHWPQDIEWAVEQIPGLRNGDIAAFGITDMSGEEMPAVLVQCRMADAVERAAFKADVTARVKNITGMNCLVELVPPRSLPRTSSGKLSRSKARTLYLSGDLVPVDKAA